jgi:hypothetical protein
VIVALFARYIGIDYSGAQTPAASLPGLRVYQADGECAAGRGRAATITAQILVAARYCPMAGGAACRGRADAGRH